jgi:hypothetical protein
MISIIISYTPTFNSNPINFRIRKRSRSQVSNSRNQALNYNLSWDFGLGPDRNYRDETWNFENTTIQPVFTIIKMENHPKEKEVTPEEILRT